MARYTHARHHTANEQTIKRDKRSLDGRTDGRTDPGGVTLQNKAHKNSNFRQAEAFFPPLFVIIILLDCHVCNVEPSWRLLPGGRKQSKEKNC